MMATPSSSNNNNESKWWCHSVCPDGSAPPLPDQWIDGDLYCGNLDAGLRKGFIVSEEDGNMTSDEICQNYDPVYANALAYTCGCPNTQPSCTICEDNNNELPTPDKQILLNTYVTCMDIQREISLDVASNIAFDMHYYSCTDYQALVGQACGCSNPKAVAKSHVCHICGPHTPLPEPFRIATTDDDDGVTCLEREFYRANKKTDLNGEASGRCEKAQKEYSDICCRPSSSSSLETTTPSAAAAAPPALSSSSTTAPVLATPNGGGHDSENILDQGAVVVFMSIIIIVVVCVAAIVLRKQKNKTKYNRSHTHDTEMVPPMYHDDEGEEGFYSDNPNNDISTTKNTADLELREIS